MSRRLLWAAALATVTLAVLLSCARGAETALPRKPRGRLLAEQLDTEYVSKQAGVGTTHRMVDNPVTFSHGGPPIYGFATRPNHRLALQNSYPSQ
jgi:hypothetical protein